MWSLKAIRPHFTSKKNKGDKAESKNKSAKSRRKKIMLVTLPKVKLSESVQEQTVAPDELSVPTSENLKTLSVRKCIVP